MNLAKELKVLCFRKKHSYRMKNIVMAGFMAAFFVCQNANAAVLALDEANDNFTPLSSEVLRDENDKVIGNTVIIKNRDESTGDITTSTFDVLNGKDGQDGVSIRGDVYTASGGQVVMNLSNGETITITDIMSSDDIRLIADEVETYQSLSGAYDRDTNSIELNIADHKDEGVGATISLDGLASEDYVDGKVSALEGQVIDIDGKVTEMDSKVTLVDNKVAEVDRKVDAVDDKVTKVDERVTEVDSRVEREEIRAKNEESAIRDEIKAIGAETNSRINKLGKEIDNVGALSAAIAGLHPRFQDGNKGEIAAAVGTYDGKQALAIGAFYAPNKKVMLSVGAALTDGGKAMGNLGVNFALDRSQDSKAVVYTQKDVEALLAKQKELEAMVNKQSEQMAIMMAELQALKASK